MAVTILDRNSHRREKPEFADVFGKYTKTTKGAGRIVGVVQKTLGLVKAVDEARGCLPNRNVVKIHDQLKTFGTVLNFAGLYEDTRDSVEAFANLAIDNGVSTTRKVAKVMSDGLGGICSWAKVITFVKPIPVVSNISNVFGLTGDVASLQMDAVDLHKARTLELAAPAGTLLKKACTHSRVYYMLAVAKDVMGLATAIFGVVIFTSMPPVALAAWALAIALLALGKDLYKANAEYEVISFDKPVRVPSPASKYKQNLYKNPRPA